MPCKDPEANRAYKAAYRVANREKRALYFAAYRAANREKVRARRAAYWSTNRAKFAAYERTTRVRVKGLVFNRNTAPPEVIAVAEQLKQLKKAAHDKYVRKTP